jgi:MoaA/NifB/PqqE/SkfB family radical SAM enzyme
MKETAFCDLPWIRFKVRSDGEITNCCWQQIGIGNVLRNSFSDLWINNNILDQIRNDTKKGVLHPLCSEFGSCPYKSESDNPEWNSWYTDEKNIFNYGKYPRTLELDLPNTHCNIGPGIPNDDTNPACIMCARRLEGFVDDTTHIFKDVCEKIQFLMPFLETIHIQGYAEPFYKDIVFEVLDWLEFNMFKNNMRLTTITNGMYFSEKVSKKWDELCDNTCIMVSIDAGSRETYKKARVADAYDLVIKNMTKYGKNKNSERHDLHINNNINMLNVKECVKMIEDADKIGADAIQLGPTDPMHMTQDICVNESNREIFEENFELARLRANISVLSLNQMWQR